MKNQERVFLIVYTATVLLITGVVTENVFTASKRQGLARSPASEQAPEAGRAENRDVKEQLEAAGLKPHDAMYWKKRTGLNAPDRGM